MQKIKKLYRDSYTGEDVVTTSTYQNSAWSFEKEWIPNQITNQTITSQALVIGNGPSWQEGYYAFDLQYVKSHRGGLLGANRLQTYGCNQLYKKFQPDFLVVDDDEAFDIVNSGYVRDHIVYAHTTQILEYPGKFYMIPQDPSWNAGAVACYLAAFDGHSKIFLMGFDGKEGQDSFYERSMLEVFNLYGDIDFVRVQPTATYYMPESWKYCVNLRQISFRDFVVEADLG